MNGKIISLRIPPALFLLAPAIFLANGCIVSERSRLVGTSEQTSSYLEGFVGESAVMIHEITYRVEKYEDNVDGWTRWTLLKSRERVYDFKAGRYEAEIEAPEYGKFFVRGNSFYFAGNNGDGFYRRLDLVEKKIHPTAFAFPHYFAVSADDSLTYYCGDTGPVFAFRGSAPVSVSGDAVSTQGAGLCVGYRILVRDGQWYLYSGAFADSIRGLIVSRDGAYKGFSIPGRIDGSIYVRNHGDVPYAMVEGLRSVPAFFDPDGKLAAGISKVVEERDVPVIEVDMARNLSLTNHAVRDLETGKVIDLGIP